ncbi:hypothetical protein [Arsenicibacter rosenii]|uniref:Phage tail protein n=1 Tax=Arsenicibacter rosenii TaxID=1750698 RepID=A0A1S2VLZ0_9BACT|nr:hypothetical protein [Arsenicibacter rosenii]OIN59797.1 hypothetical protein BLX24_08035 [Arsenicibacter rosenii]
MNDLNFTPGSANTGGVFLLRFAPLDSITAIGTEVTFAAGARWLSCYGSEGSLSWEEQQKDTDNGPVWELSVQAFLPGDSAAIRARLAAMTTRRFVLECEDNEGLVRRAGAVGAGLTFSYSFSPGANPGERRGNRITFAGQLTAPPDLID